MKSFTIAAAIVGLASSVAGHGFVSSPRPRMPGNGLKAACGDGVFNTQSSDRYGNVQGSQQNLQGSHPDCRMWQCKGVPFSDHSEIQTYTPGQKVNMKVEIRAPHDGVANVSVVNTATDKIIGKPLISWDKYALTSVPMNQHPEWTDFSFEMPDVSAECAKEGACVLQWFWDAPQINQTYESCVDFTMGSGSGSGSGNGTSSSPAASPEPAVPQDTPTTPTTPTGSGSGSGSGSSSGSGSKLPKTFTLDTFITWLRANAGNGAADKLRRMVAAGRAHPRAFRE